MDGLSIGRAEISPFSTHTQAWRSAPSALGFVPKSLLCIVDDADSLVFILFSIRGEVDVSLASQPNRAWGASERWGRVDPEYGCGYFAKVNPATRYLALGVGVAVTELAQR